MNENERAIAMAQAELRRLQRMALAIQAKVNTLIEEEAESSYLDSDGGRNNESMRLGQAGPDGWGPTSVDRTLFSLSKWKGSRIRKHGKARREKPLHKQW